MLGVHGFFASYDARPGEPLDRAEAALWADGLAAVRGGGNVPDELARRSCAACRPVEALPAASGTSCCAYAACRRNATPLTRAEAARLVYRLLAR